MDIFWMLVAGSIAFLFGRSLLIWGFLGYMIGWPAMIGLALLGIKVKTWERRVVWANSLNEKANNFRDEVEKTTVPKEYKDFETVDDLMKQLDKK